MSAISILHKPSRHELRLLWWGWGALLLAAGVLWWGLNVWQEHVATRAVAEFRELLGAPSNAPRSNSRWLPKPYEVAILRRFQQDPRSKQVHVLATLGSTAWLRLCVGDDLAFTLQLDGRRRDARITDMARVDPSACRQAEPNLADSH